MKTNRTAWSIVVCLILSFAIGPALVADVAGTRSAGIVPTVNIFRGGKCVEDTEFMRRNHMDVLRQQSDATVRRGIRTTKYSLKDCVNCHADPKTNSVLGKDGFCESCHTFAPISIDCFSCHSPSPEKEGPPPKAAAALHGSRLKQDEGTVGK
jgi:hypothetical protein